MPSTRRAALVRLYQIEHVRPGRPRAGRASSTHSVDQVVTALKALEKKVGVSRAGGRDQPARERGRPRAPGRRPPPLRGGARPDRHHQVEGDPGFSRGCDRPLRGRRQRARGRRREARLIADGFQLPRRRRADLRRPRLRLHQRLSRRGQFDRDGRLDARAVAGQGGHLGGVLQLRGRVPRRHRCRARPSAPGMVDLSRRHASR